MRMSSQSCPRKLPQWVTEFERLVKQVELEVEQLKSLGGAQVQGKVTKASPRRRAKARNTAKSR